MEYLIPAILVTIVTAISLYLRWMSKNDDYFEKRGIPYNPRVSLITFVWRFLSKPMHEMHWESYKKHGRIYGGFDLRRPTLTVCEPDLLRDILVKDFHIFNYRRDFENVGDSNFNKVVSIAKGEDWKRIRTIITPAFTSRRMRQMSHIVNECSQTVAETLGKYADQKEPADFKSIFGAFTLDVIASAAFATKIDSLNDPENIFVKKVKESFLKPSMVLLVFFILPGWISKRFRLTSLSGGNFFAEVILQVMKERRQTGKKYDDILQMFMDVQDEVENASEPLKSNIEEDDTDQYGSITNNGITFRPKHKKLTQVELVAQCVLFFVVGYETTAATLSYMAYSLALNPECQEKLIKEVDEIFEKHEELDYDVIRDMKYLDCVVSETLRMYPALARSQRTACEDYKLGNTGIVIEKGTLVNFNIHSMHHDPEFFPSPEKFEPERFMSDRANHPQYAYLPFGAGPRNCLGMRFALMEIKLCMSNILRHYRFKIAETTKIPLEFKKGVPFMSLDKLPLLIERRSR